MTLRIGQRVRVLIDTECSLLCAHLRTWPGGEGRIVAVCATERDGHPFAVESERADQYGSVVEDFRAEELEVVE